MVAACWQRIERNGTLANTATPGAVDRFIDRLETLDAGGRARLKRNAGRTLNEARDVYQVFFSMLPYEMPLWDQEDYFLIATLYAVGTRRENPRLRNTPRSVGASLRRIRGDNDDRRTSLDKRFQTLLEADREQLPFRLRQIVSLLAANEIAIDWARLLRDVQFWEKGEGKVQRRWAEHYYVGTTDTSDAQPTVEPSTVATTEESNKP